MQLPSFYRALGGKLQLRGVPVASLESDTRHLERDMVERLSSLDAKTPFGLMKFRLTFDGPLRGAGGRGDNRAAEKWSIRKQLHPQIAELYQLHPVLNQEPKFVMWSAETAVEETVLGAIRRPKPVNGFNFVSVVRAPLHLMCDLDILFLRKGEPGRLFLKDGDLDKRLRTLFDGLKIPEKSDFSAGQPDPSQEPFYCLLEDDSLVSGFSVTTDRLLTGPHATEDHVLLVIDVTVRVMQVSALNVGFLGD